MILEGDLPVEPEEENQEDKSIVETITHYGKSITQHLKNAVACTVAASGYANDSLVDLQSQNENLNRIKNTLNESHNTVTATQKIVDCYVNSMRWIRKSIPWQKPVTLSNGVLDTGREQQIPDEEPMSYWCSIFRSQDDKAECIVPPADGPVGEALGEFSRTASTHLDTLISEIRSNRHKTQLIATAVQKQNDELEKIGDSALSLQQRVSQVNKVLQDNA